MKLYIFITTSLKVAGGSQCYTAAKAQYLEEEGWKTLVFFQDDHQRNHKCLIGYLNKFLDCDTTGISNPPFIYPDWLRNKILSKMIKIIGDYKLYDQIIIESHENAYSQWGEILASKINAKHFVFLMNERFRGPNMEYDKKIEYYFFKYNRKEIISGKVGISKLFEGYVYLENEDLPDYLELDESPIQDVPNERVNNIARCDWNICYIGRGNKSYVPFILNDIGRFAGDYPEKTIQLISISDLNIHRQTIKSILSDNNNLSICELGYLHPIPTNLFKKIDVVIAGAGSARHSCEEGAIVIVADTETKMSNGILGYETLDSVYKSGDSVCTDYVDALKRVLVDKVHLKMKNQYPPKKGFRETVLKQFELFNKSCEEVQYYNEKLLVEGKRNWIVTFKIFMHQYFPKLMSLLRNLKER